MRQTWGQTGRSRIILPETLAELELRSSQVRKTFRLSRASPGHPPSLVRYRILTFWAALLAASEVGLWVVAAAAWVLVDSHLF
jgi:hypothetical protein